MLSYSFFWDLWRLMSPICFVFALISHLKVV